MTSKKLEFGDKVRCGNLFLIFICFDKKPRPVLCIDRKGTLHWFRTEEERLAKNLDTKYSDLDNDLGNISDYEEFVTTLSKFFNECSRILKPKKYMCIVVSDFRHKEKYYMFHSDLAQKLEDGYFALKGITILYQRFKKVFPYGYPYSFVPNIHHQYILIFQNKKKE